MQNPNPDNGQAGQTNASPQPTVADQATVEAAKIGLEAQAQMNVVKDQAAAQAAIVGDAAKTQLSNVSQAAQVQMQNLGQTGTQAVGDIGKAGVKQMGSLMSQFTQPLTSKVAQPPVKQDEKIYAGVAYIPFVSIVSIILKPDSAFVRLHAKQGLLLSIIFMFVGMLAAIVSIFGIIGALLSFILGLVPLACLIISVYSMYLAFSGYWWKIPMLGAVADLIPVEMMAKVSKENITGQFAVAKDDFDNRTETISKEVQQNVAQPSPVVNNVAGAEQPMVNTATVANTDGTKNTTISK